MFNSYQEAFDSTIEKLVAQGKRAVFGTSCFYLSPEGNKCAVGVHLPDGHEAQGCRGVVGSLLSKFPDIESVLKVSKSIDFDEMLYFWEFIQSIHDSGEKIFVDYDLQELETRFGIDTSNARLELWHDAFQ